MKKRIDKKGRARESIIVGTIVACISIAMILTGVWMYGDNTSEGGSFGSGGGYASAESISQADPEDGSEAAVGSGTESDSETVDNGKSDSSEGSPDEPSVSGTESSGNSGSRQPAVIEGSEQEIETGGDEYGFQYGRSSNISRMPSYFRFTSEKYGFWCDLPDSFFRIEGSNIWRASDDTAQMELIAYVNEYGLTPRQALDQYISEIGGPVFYSDTGSDWFAVSLSRDGIEYYKKCFVDDYIRAFEFITPHEYIDIYSGYITHIEKNFKRT